MHLNSSTSWDFMSHNLKCRITNFKLKYPSEWPKLMNFKIDRPILQIDVNKIPKLQLSQI